MTKTHTKEIVDKEMEMENMTPRLIRPHMDTISKASPLENFCE